MEQQQADFLKERINNCPFNRYNKIRAVSVEEGRSLVEAELSPESMNIWDLPHGGLLFALGDVAAGLAAHSLNSTKVVTVSATISFLAAADRKASFLQARGTVLKAGRSTLFISVEITDSTGTEVAAGQYVMHRVSEKDGN